MASHQEEGALNKMKPVILEGPSEPLGYLSELELGHQYRIGKTIISLNSALSFANVFDPFSFHNDPETAKGSMFGGLIVSGLQSLSVVHALSVLGGFLVEDPVICGAGIDELRFAQPIRPDEVLDISAEVIELKTPRVGRDYGIARLKYWIKNPKGETVMTFIDNHVLKDKPHPLG